MNFADASWTRCIGTVKEMGIGNCGRLDSSGQSFAFQAMRLSIALLAHLRTFWPMEATGKPDDDLKSLIYLVLDAQPVESRLVVLRCF